MLKVIEEGVVYSTSEKNTFFPDRAPLCCLTENIFVYSTKNRAPAQMILFPWLHTPTTVFLGVSRALFSPNTLVSFAFLFPFATPMTVE